MFETHNTNPPLYVRTSKSNNLLYPNSNKPNKQTFIHRYQNCFDLLRIIPYRDEAEITDSELLFDKDQTAVEVRYVYIYMCVYVLDVYIRARRRWRSGTDENDLCKDWDVSLLDCYIVNACVCHTSVFPLSSSLSPPLLTLKPT